jgi:hypothetical protein
MTYWFINHGAPARILEFRPHFSPSSSKNDASARKLLLRGSRRVGPGRGAVTGCEGGVAIIRQDIRDTSPINGLCIFGIFVE